MTVRGSFRGRVTVHRQDKPGILEERVLFDNTVTPG